MSNHHDPLQNSLNPGKLSRTLNEISDNWGKKHKINSIFSLVKTWTWNSQNRCQTITTYDRDIVVYTAVAIAKHCQITNLFEFWNTHVELEQNLIKLKKTQNDLNIESHQDVNVNLSDLMPNNHQPWPRHPCVYNTDTAVTITTQPDHKTI